MSWRPKLRGNLAKAYAAGIIDGEGTITIRQIGDKSAKEGYRLQLLVELGLTNEWVPQWLKLNWGGQVYVREDPRNKAWKPIWRWMIGSQQAKRFLQDISPYLVVKQAQAELGIKFQQAKGKRGYRLSEAAKAVEEAQRVVIRVMNRKGVENVSVET